MAEPFLNLRNVGLMVEGVSGGPGLFNAME